MIFLFSGVTSEYDIFKKILRENGFEPYPDTKDTKDGELYYKQDKIELDIVDYLHARIIIGTGYDKNIYSARSRVQNLNDTASQQHLINKDKLHKLLARSKYIARTWEMREFVYPDKQDDNIPTNTSKNQVFICRPANFVAGGGHDVVVVSNKEEYDRAKATYEEKIAIYSKFKTERMRHYNVIVSEYIRRPVLARGRKMHIRGFMITRSDRPNWCTIAPFGIIQTAELPYVESDWDNSKIHDTHLKSTKDTLYFPEDYEGDAELYLQQMKELEAELCAVIGQPTPYDTAEKSYEMFGLDIMFDIEANRIVLLEINDRMGSSTAGDNEAKKDAFYAKYFAWEFENIRTLF